MPKKREVKVPTKPVKGIRLRLLLGCSDYTTIKPILALYISCFGRLNDLIAMNDIVRDGPITWQQYDYWLAKHLVEKGLSKESAEELASTFVCCWFQWNKEVLFGPEPNHPPIVFPTRSLA